MSAFYMGIVVPSVVVLPITLAISRYQYWKAPERLSFLYLIFSAVFNIIAKITAIKHINNLPILHIYTILEFGLLCLILRSFFKEEWIKKTLLYLLVIFPLVSVNYILLTHSLFEYNVFERFLSSLILMAACLYFLITDLGGTTGTGQSFFNFCIVTGLLLYFSSSSALFGLAQYLQADKLLNTFIWNIHATFVLVMYLFFAVAYLKIDRPK